MLISDYLAFVTDTDSAPKKDRDAKEVAIYGLAGEIGSLVAALKRRLLSDGRTHWNAPNPKIIEEMGDCLWYLFALGDAHGIGADFLAKDVEGLQNELGSTDARSVRIRERLGQQAKEFLQAAPTFIALFTSGQATLDDYRRLAYLTRRTEDDQLVEVCIAVLQQLAAELFRTKLPTIELELNKRLEDRDFMVILGETAWHLAALASLYGLTLVQVAEANMAKVTRRYVRNAPPLPDEAAPEDERFPGRFSVSFVSVGEGRSRMYLEGRRLGDDLTDNARKEDGYRFHDVMHLALVAKLGWSPVLRGMMKRKRKSDPKTDEVEDGARAKIVEEAVVNAIHAEGRRLVALAPGEPEAQQPMFINSGDVTFSFLRQLEHFVDGLEVQESGYWQWEEAIVEGSAIFQQLRQHRRGTVHIDLGARTISFSPEVLIDLRGVVAGAGLASADEVAPALQLSEKEAALAQEHGADAVHCRRRAVHRALGLADAQLCNVEIVGWQCDVADVRLAGDAQKEAWRRGIVAFKVAAAHVNGCTIATAIALADP